MGTRRKFIQRTGGLLVGISVPSISVAQEQPTPQFCQTSEQFDQWTVFAGPHENQDLPADWRVQEGEPGSVSTALNYNGTPLMLKSEANISVIKSDTTSSPDSLVLRVNGPWVLFPSEKGDYYLTAVFKDTKQELEIFVDGVNFGRVERNHNSSESKTDFVIPSAMEAALRTGQTLTYFGVMNGQRVSETSVSLSGLGDALDAAPQILERQVAAVEEAGECSSLDLCVMTSAAVDILGRRDDCFELTQMRRLRAKFQHQQGILDDYIVTSLHILSGPRSALMDLILLVFYALVVWPTALLVRIDAFQAGRALYLTGFAALKLVLLRRQLPVQDS